MSKESNHVRLTQLTTSSGCAAKVGPGLLQDVLARLPLDSSERLLVGIETGDDAAVYRVSDELAFIATVDFFTPVVDEPRLFGQIAATNALSDVYAMGGEPLLALNVVAFPVCSLGTEVLAEILAGGAEKVKESGAVLAGGHSVEDKEPKYGLCVIGSVHPQRVITNAGARPGDILVLTKPLGTGIVVAAIKAGMAPEGARQSAVRWMTRLNRKASQAAARYGVHAMTDVTGFGLLGHLKGMLAASGVSARITAARVPAHPGAKELAGMGLVPAGTYANRSYLGDWVEFAPSVATVDQDVLLDPQSSGGLLISVAPEQARDLVRELEEGGDLGSAIGVLEDGTPGRIYVE
ncbi:MAG: selenide, water dikinase SelD [Bacillota bacterium]